MRNTISAAVAVLTLGVGLCMAQGPRGRQVGNGVCANGMHLDLAKAQTITGAVTAVNISAGTQYPSIEVGKTLIKVAPAWFLLQQDFEIRTGDTVQVQAAPSTSTTDSYLYALQIVKAATGQSITLRDSSGVPVWTGGGAGRQGRGNGVAAAHGSCVDPASITTVSGVVQQVTSGVGITMPVLVLKLSDGTLLTVRIGPERILLERDFELTAGETVKVKLAHLTCTDEYIALAITNSAGATVVLREDDGTPAWH